MITVVGILQHNSSEVNAWSEHLRITFEKVQDGIVGKKCLDRILRVDGTWSYLDGAMQSRWQGYQLACLGGVKEYSAERILEQAMEMLAPPLVGPLHRFACDVSIDQTGKFTATNCRFSVIQVPV